MWDIYWLFASSHSCNCLDLKQGPGNWQQKSGKFGLWKKKKGCGNQMLYVFSLFCDTNAARRISEGEFGFSCGRFFSSAEQTSAAPVETASSAPTGSTASEESFQPARSRISQAEVAAVQPVMGISQRVHTGPRKKKDLGTTGALCSLHPWKIGLCLVLTQTCSLSYS